MEVEKLLNDKGIKFLPSGRDFKVSCLNPEHNDSNPSMRIDRITGIYNCFSCGYKGNIFSLYNVKANSLQIKKELFRRKLELKLAENIGLDFPTNYSKYDNSWRGIKSSTFLKFEAFEHHDPHFIGRLVFPIRNIAGKIVGFNARAFNPEVQPKYLVHPSNCKLPLFPARVEHINGHVLLVEGIFDMLNLYDKGLTNAVCAFGTKKVTKEKLALLKVQGVTCIDILFDSDEAGKQAIEEVIKLAESLDLTHRNITLKSGDPGDLTADKVLKLKEKLYG